MGVVFIDEDHVRINGNMVNVIEELGKNGACREADPDLFFPENTKDRTMFEAISKAKSICYQCPVVDLCLEYALRSDPYGVWGATTEADRKQIRIDRRLRRDADRQKAIRERKNIEQYGQARKPVERKASNLRTTAPEAFKKLNAERSEATNLMLS